MSANNIIICNKFQSFVSCVIELSIKTMVNRNNGQLTGRDNNISKDAAICATCHNKLPKLQDGYEVTELLYVIM